MKYHCVFFILRGELPITTCAPGRHLVSCTNGYPINTTACICWGSNFDGPKCRGICTAGIDNFEIVSSEIRPNSVLAQSKCSQWNHVLGCHIRPAPRWLPSDNGNSYYPSDDGKSCICDGSPGTLCIATCGYVDPEHYEIVKYSDTENIRVTCSGDKHVLGCGILSHTHFESRRIGKMAMNGNLYSCKCSDMDYVTCFAICGRY